MDAANMMARTKGVGLRPPAPGLERDRQHQQAAPLLEMSAVRTLVMR